MSCGKLPDEDHVVRYAGFTDFWDREQGKVNCSAFMLRPNRPPGHSVNWLEHFEDLDKTQQLDEVRRLIRLCMGATGGLVELNVGKTKSFVLDEHDYLIQFLHTPLCATEKYEADPSHSDIMGLPKVHEEDLAELIGDAIAKCVIEVHST